MDQDQLMSFVDNTYQKVTGPLPVVGSAMDLAEDYRASGKHIHACVDNLIRWQCTKTAMSGFVTGLGGFITMPVSIPADFAQSIYVQLRMVAAIGHLYGHDIHSDKVRALCIACLCGGSATEILTNAGIKIGQKFAKNLIKSISKETIIAINKKVGYRLLTKFGTTGTINLGKCVPFLGAGIGSVLNLTYTYSIGKAAKNILGTDLNANTEENNNESIVLRCDDVSVSRDNCVGFVYGPKIFDLQLGMQRLEAEKALRKLANKYSLEYKEADDKCELYSPEDQTVWVTSFFDEYDKKIIAYSFSPKVFHVKEFHSPNFIDKFIRHYQLPEFYQDGELESETLKSINESENYELVLSKYLLEVRSGQEEEEPYFG